MRPAKVRRLERTRVNGGVAPVVRHGRNVYANWGCRCRICRTDHAAYTRAVRTRRWAATHAAGGLAPAWIAHGASGYTNWGCHCPTCLAGLAEDKRRRRR